MSISGAIGVLLLAGCGGDEEDGGRASTAGTETAETAARKAEPPVVTETALRTAPERKGSGTRTSPEDAEGGAGDEIPTASQALITGRGGKLSPRVVRVPPFIAVRIELRSADGGAYSLAGGGTKVDVDRDVRSVAATIDGLRTGESLVLKGPQGSVTIEANAEPGP